MNQSKYIVYYKEGSEYSSLYNSETKKFANGCNKEGMTYRYKNGTTETECQWSTRKYLDFPTSEAKTLPLEVFLLLN